MLVKVADDIGIYCVLTVRDLLLKLVGQMPKGIRRTNEEGRNLGEEERWRGEQVIIHLKN